MCQNRLLVMPARAAHTESRRAIEQPAQLRLGHRPRLILPQPSKLSNNSDLPAGSGQRAR